MKPDFALSLSFEGITLLQRVSGGWMRVGDVALDVSDLRGALGQLRAKADSLSPDGGQVKLVIPNEQIRYLSLTAPKGDVGLHDAIEAALEGATPYAVADLVYDWSRKGDTLLVAAVAKETLDEAQGFTAGHHFEPVSYVAIAPPGAFEGEVFFGPAPDWTGSAPERDDSAMVRVSKPTPAPEPEVVAEPAMTPEPEAEVADGSKEGAASEPTSDTKPEDEAQVSDAAKPVAEARAEPELDVVAQAEPEVQAVGEPKVAAKPADPEPTPEVTPVTHNAAAPTDETSEKPRAPAPSHASEVTPEDPQPAPDDKAALAPGAADADRPAPASLKVPQPDTSSVAAPSIAPHTETASPTGSFSSIRATRDASGPVPSLRIDPPKTTASAPRLAVKPQTDALASDAASTPDLTAPGINAAASFERADLDAQSAEPSVTSRLGGFFSRRGKTPAPEAAEPAVAATPAPRKPVEPPKRVVTSALARVTALRSKTAGARGDATPQDAERDRMTVFGARSGDARVGGKPRFLGLMLTMALLLMLVGVAAWASVFLDDGLARFFRQDISPDVAIAEADLSEPTTEETTEEADAETVEPVELAALDTGALTESDLPVADVLAQPDRPRALTEIEADATYAATGIWQRAPDAPLEPAQGNIDDIYVASIDSDVPQFDAVALPEAPMRGDLNFVSPPIPAPAGVVFDLDSRGLVRAVPEGAMNADGIVIYAGLPPVVPPLRPDASAVPVPDTPQVREEQNRLQRQRPKARPDDIVEQNERATLGGNSRQELAAMRPIARPAVAKLEEEADVTATRLAITTSRKPLPRPRDINRIVERARATTAADPAPETVQVASAAAVAPRVVSPAIPSKTSVAQQATVRNAINLRQINLIGVYGKPSARRALVRLSNGRYQKVKVGDRVDGGRVAAIGESELRYSKGGRNVVLKMPR